MKTQGKKLHKVTKQTKEQAIVLYKRWVRAIPAVKQLYNEGLMKEEGVQKLLETVGITFLNFDIDRVLSEAYWRERMEKTMSQPEDEVKKQIAEDDGAHAASGDEELEHEEVTSGN